MEYMKKHLGQWDINGYKSYASSISFMEYVTCVKGRRNDEKGQPWTCILGAYERYCETDRDYDYKILKIPLAPAPLKKKAFELANPGHVLIKREDVHR